MFFFQGCAVLLIISCDKANLEMSRTFSICFKMLLVQDQIQFGQHFFYNFGMWAQKRQSIICAINTFRVDVSLLIKLLSYVISYVFLMIQFQIGINKIKTN